jgi:hypothetical protein
MGVPCVWGRTIPNYENLSRLDLQYFFPYKLLSFGFVIFLGFAAWSFLRAI